MHTLELKDIEAGYDGKTVISGITFTASESSLYVVLGQNGAGKTTLFRTIAGILEPSKGQVLLDGINTGASAGLRGRINYLSHYNALPEEMTVYNALEFYSKMEDGNVEKAIDLLKLGWLRDKKIKYLSQGQKKLVSIAKVFLRDRDVYLLDEPTANLDPAVSKLIRDMVLNMSKNKIVLYSSHNLYEATDIGTNIIFIKDGKLALFDRISNIKSGSYKIGIRASEDISNLIDKGEYISGYYVLTVSGPEEAGLVLKNIVEKGILVTEMRELTNPLQELF